MYHKEQITFNYSSVPNAKSLSAVHGELLEKAFAASQLAYAPYSKFRVGAVALLSNGEIVSASNKENAAYPAGICAERNLMNYVSDRYPKESIVTVAIAANPENFELTGAITPCGICRQVMCETEKVQKGGFEIILGSPSGQVLIFPSAASLLPLHFHEEGLKK